MERVDRRWSSYKEVPHRSDFQEPSLRHQGHKEIDSLRRAEPEREGRATPRQELYIFHGAEERRAPGYQQLRKQTERYIGSSHQFIVGVGPGGVGG